MTNVNFKNATMTQFNKAIETRLNSCLKESGLTCGKYDYLALKSWLNWELGLDALNLWKIAPESFFNDSVNGNRANTLFGGSLGNIKSFRTIYDLIELMFGNPKKPCKQCQAMNNFFTLLQTSKAPYYRNIMKHGITRQELATHIAKISGLTMPSILNLGISHIMPLLVASNQARAEQQGKQIRYFFN